MIYLVPGSKPNNLTLIFSLPHSKEIKHVSVVGTFNNFSQSATPLKQCVPNGPWEASVIVPRDSQQMFRYLVNESKWQFDPDIPGTKSNQKSEVFSFIIAKLSPRKSATTQSAGTASDVQLLMGMVPATLNQPKKRISLANSMLKLALKPDLEPQDRLDLLQQAVFLDPFNTQIRLALGQVLQELGLFDEAVASFKQVLDLRPGEPRVHLLLGEALLAAGQLDEARDIIKKVPVEGKMGRRAAYDLVEIDLRKAGDEDWKKILDTLTRLGGQPGEEGLFCEKCLKLLGEWDAPDASQSILTLVNSCYAQSSHAAVAAVRLAAGNKLPANLSEIIDPPSRVGESSSSPTHVLLRTLTGFRLARALPVSSAEDRVTRLGEWRKVMERMDSRWPELRHAYLHQLSDWAVQAYKKKDFDLAATLWGEAGRVAPNLPVIQQNLAIVNTRLGEDAAQAWHWQQLTRAWTLYTELMPEADGYGKHIIQKHQAFVQGAEAKLPTLQTPAEILELGALWVKEAAPLLALRQLAFRNPLYRCGVMSDDYVGKDERSERLEEGFGSAVTLLRMSHEWLGLSDTSALAQKRLQRLDQAYQQAAAGGDAAYRHYDEEKEAFKVFRELAVHQYLLLLFRILLPSAEKLDLNDKPGRQRYALVARGLMAFPHRALKPGVLKAVEQLEEDTDMQQLVTNYAVGPWFKRAQELMQNKQPDKAAPFLEEALQIAPDFTVGMFYLAQCRIEQKRYDEITPLLTEARAKCMEGDELIEHIDKLLEQLPMILIADEFRNAQKFMQEEDWKHALDNLEQADKISPGLVPVLFYTAVCHFRLEHWDQADMVAHRALKLCTEEEHKDAKEQLEILIKQLPMARIAKTVEKAREFMDREQWRDALKVLDKLLTTNEKILVPLFYKTVCHFRLEEWSQSEMAAIDAQALCGKEDQEIKEQLKTLREQIPLARRASAIRPITQAIESESWQSGITAADRFLRENGDDPVVLFYKALCQYRGGNGASAKSTAEEAKIYATGAEYKDLRNQLDQLIEASSRPAVSKDFNEAVQAMNNENWLEAMTSLNKVISKDSSNGAAHYYWALCWFQFTMEPLKKSRRKIEQHEVQSYISSMEMVISSLDKAERYSSRSDRDLRKGIDNLREAASNVLRQLRGY